MSTASLTLAQVADLLGAELIGDADHVITGLGTLGAATESQVSFLDNPKYASQLSGSRAGGVILSPKTRDLYDGNALVMAQPRLGFARLSQIFEQRPILSQGVDATAVVDPSADISATAAIGAHVVIGADCKIGSSVRLWPGVVVSDGCSIGDGTEIFPNTTLYHNVHIGKSTRIHAGCVIGADGFGFEKTGPVGEWVRMAQTGGVRIGDHCDIGAGVTIDRGAIEDTVLGNNVILDNQIQVGHNCVLKDGTLMSGYTAIGGSTELGYHCLVGGGSLFAGHLKVADGTIITGGTSVSGSIKTRGIYSAGLPHAPNREWRKNIVRFRKLDEMYKRMVALEKKLDRLASEGPEDTPYD